jgi:predicted HD superfamily hydrolase involved in NAD metabolism
VLNFVADQQLVDKLRVYLSPARVEHSLNVAEAAWTLALRFAPELADKAALAGLLHDNAKGLGAAELMEAARLHDIDITPAERKYPKLLHGKVGAALLGERFGVWDAEIGQCVADHVTGRVGMGPLSRVLFVADQTARDRDFYGVEELRQVAAASLERAVLIVARIKLIYVISKQRIIEPMTVAVYNEQLMRVQEHGA